MARSDISSFDACRKIFVTSLVCLFVFSGCGESESPVADQPSKAQKSKPVATRSVTPSTPALETSPAEVTTKLPEADASPTEVCRKFLQLLRSGNRLTAENLLTRSALAVTGRANLSIEPIGGPNAKYTFGKPSYATNKQKLAQVVCTINDSIDGEDYETTLTWMAKKKKEGWRISGMIVQLSDEGPADLLSFENYNDVLRIKQTISGPEASVAEVEQDSTLK